MWVRSTAFYYMVKALHGNGFIRAFAIYLFNEMQIPYEKFYDGAIDYFESEPDLFVSRLYFDLKNKAEELSLGITNRKLMFEPCGEIVWDDHEYVVLNALSQLDIFYDELIPYLESYGIKKDVFADLLNYQKAIMRKPSDELQSVELSYDIHSYLRQIYVNNYQPLAEKKKNVHIVGDACKVGNLRTVIWQAWDVAMKL